MKALVTAGSTQTPIDKVRCITNIFKGNTGANIAAHLYNVGFEVTLVANHGAKEQLKQWVNTTVENNNIKIITYKTYNDLHNIMRELIPNSDYDVIIHSAAVSDYRAVDVMALNSHALLQGLSIPSHDKEFISLKSVMNDKVRSNHNELYIKLEKTEKLIDKIRDEWDYNGILVKFKLEVGISEEELIKIASTSRKASKADIIVANFLDNFSKNDRNILILGEGETTGVDEHFKVSRKELGEVLAIAFKDKIESHHL